LRARRKKISPSSLSLKFSACTSRIISQPPTAAHEVTLMPFAATDFEFKQRFWIIGGIIFCAFFCYYLDHTGVAFALAGKILGPGVNHDSPIFDRYVLGIIAIGAGFVYLAALIRSWAESYLHSSIVHDANIHSEQLVAEGPYRHVRNPLYLGNDLLALGLGLMTSRLGFVVMVVGMFLFTYRLILREEAGLLATQGESYRRYFNAVPRLWPSLFPRVPTGGAAPNWRDGFTGELFMWSIALGMTVFIITTKLWYCWAVMGGGFAIYFLQAAMRKRPSIS
jgi:protein-S-isoprenylcysteine O-methyltransferase Ste14